MTFRYSTSSDTTSSYTSFKSADFYTVHVSFLYCSDVTSVSFKLDQRLYPTIVAGGRVLGDHPHVDQNSSIA